jgi:hypothetical protein
MKTEVIDCSIRYFVAAKDRTVAERFAAQRLEAAGFAPTDSEWAPYEKTGGWVGTFRWQLTPVKAEWSTVVYELLTACQRIGYQWTVSGRIDETLELLTNKPSGYGIAMITLTARRREQFKQVD